MKLWWLFLFPVFLSATSYECDEDPSTFSAKIEGLPDFVSLEKKQTFCLKLKHPSNFKLHQIAHEEDQSEFQWDPHFHKSTYQEKGSEFTQLTINFDPQKKGQFYLNPPAIHLVSESDPHRFVTLYPPLLKMEVRQTPSDNKLSVFPKSVLALDLRRPIEIDFDNEKNLMDKPLVSKQSSPLSLDPYLARSILKGLIIFLMGAFILYKGWQFLSRQRPIKKIFSKEIDPRRRAFRELQDLNNQMLIQKGLYEEFYVKLTVIIRRYIESQFNIKATEQTTPEFLEELLKKNIFVTKLNNYLSEFLKFADLVKFAKLHPQPDDCQAAEKAAFNFLEESESQSTSHTGELPNGLPE